MKQTKFKVGDRVKVREDLTPNQWYFMDDSINQEYFVDGMNKYAGAIATITHVNGDRSYFLDISSLKYFWTDEMLESVNNGPDMGSIIDRFLSAKFQDMTCEYHCHEGESHRVGSLFDILDEFKAILDAGELVEAENTRTGQYVLIDKSKGTVIGTYGESFLK